MKCKICNDTGEYSIGGSFGGSSETFKCKCNSYTNRTTPSIVKDLKPEEIFVFGSNLAGKHGKGAAKKALEWGAVYGKGIGKYGYTYALPTKDKDIKTLHLEKIKMFVKQFILEVKSSPNWIIWLVTPIGCGLAGYKPEEIAPFFEEVIGIKNIHLPKTFWEVLLILKK